jgi:hypothetical protein
MGFQLLVLFAIVNLLTNKRCKKMENYFRTLNATRQMHGMNQVAKGAKFLDQGALHKAYKSALKRHHGITAEAKFIISIYEDGRKAYEGK